MTVQASRCTCRSSRWQLSGAPSSTERTLSLPGRRLSASGHQACAQA